MSSPNKESANKEMDKENENIPINEPSSTAEGSASCGDDKQPGATAEESATQHLSHEKVIINETEDPVPNDHKHNADNLSSTVSSSQEVDSSDKQVNISNDGCESISQSVPKCHHDSPAPKSSAELPSLGILVEDFGPPTASSISLNDQSKDNNTMKSVSAKIRMESPKGDSPQENLDNKNAQELQALLKLASTIDVNPASATEKNDVGNSKPHEHIDESTGARRKSEVLSPTSSQAANVPPHEVIHRVKKIKFLGKELPIITQNNNGPCPLLAILNALLLKGEVELGVDSNEVKGGHLVSVVANALIDLAPRNSQSNNPDQQNIIQQNTDDAVQLLDKLLTGLDVNVRFSGVQDFEFTPELCVFDGLNITLYHGWVVDPECQAAEVVQQLTYNQLTTNIYTWRHEASDKSDNELILKAVECEEFLQQTSSQLTVHGLFTLGSTMREGEVAVLFRNNHFSTIYKHKEQLYQLLTDQGFLNEAAVWQTLSDVDASFSEFVTASFEAWQLQAQDSPADTSSNSMTKEQQITSDEQLAAVLQRESDQRVQDEAKFSETLEQLGCDSSMTDEEIARRLQQDEDMRAEEDAANEERQAAGGRERNTRTRLGGSAASRSPTQSPPPPPPPSSPTPRHNNKKKDQCCIL